MSPVVALTDVTKSFGETRALDGLNLRVKAGEVHGLLGPNGAGKSTAIRIMLGMLRASSGDVSVLGADPWTASPDRRGRLAYVPGDVSLWPSLTGGEIIDLLGKMHGGQDRTRREDLVRRFDLDTRRRARTYSKGNRQKVGLVAAFSVDADLLVLDEPTSGLDPLMEEVFKQCVAEARRRGTTVLLSSHILSEVEQVCDRVSIVRSGQVVDTGSLAELRRHATTTIRATLDTVPDGLEQTAGVERVEVDANRVVIVATELNAVMATLTAAGLETLDVSPPTLEDLFLHYYGAAPTPTTSRLADVA